MNYHAYNSCVLCPHECGVNRNEGESGTCGAGSGQHISSVCVHKGEEPAISGEKGICNVFFSHCNLACIYCQNHQISCAKNPIETIISTEEVVNQIIEILDDGIRAVGFVSPSHMVLQVIDIIENLHREGYHPVTVWNSNAYDKPETLRMLESYIDIYLPDFKYADDELAKQYSGIDHYSSIAIKAVKEMYYQKGNTLLYDEHGQLERGLVIRHLVLPNHTENSISVMNLIAEEISFRVAVSLMSQYYPPADLQLPYKLTRNLKKEEYETVVEHMQELGITKGWIQEFESQDFYRPDFNQEHPFERF